MAVTEEGSIRIDIGLLESSIKDMMSPHLLVSPNCCIFKTPAILKMHNEKSYIPIAFSIGPLHHDDPNLKATEKIKVKYLQGLISRSNCSDEMLGTLITSITKVGKEACECYAEAIDQYCSLEEFLKILVIDDCFIIELFYRKVFPEFREKKNDPIFSMSSMLEVLDHDLMLLENQVPWMVLEHLFSLCRGPGSTVALSNLTHQYFSPMFPFDPTFGYDHLRDIKHIPDLFRKLCISSIKVEKEKMLIRGWELVPSATRLVEAGIKFRKSTSNNMFDIKFRNGVLEIPQIMIHEGTEIFFRNLISFEQCYPNNDIGMITSYAILLDNLINTEQDVDILSSNTG